MLGTVLAGFRDALLFPGCPACGEPCGGEELCEPCRAQLFEIRNQVPIPDGIQDLLVLWEYSGTARRLIVQAKEEPRSPCTLLMKRHLFAKLQTLGLEPGPVFAPPASWQRVISGWHLAEHLAESMRAQLGWSGEGFRFHRKGISIPQVSLNGLERRQALRGRFRFRVGKRTVPKRVWLMDDVLTTGATLAECARALRAVGVKRVGAWTLCRSDRFPRTLGGYTKEP